MGFPVQRVESRQGTYPIHIRCHYLKEISSLIKKHPQARIGIITDTHLYRIYHSAISSLLEKKHIHILTIPAGERHKSIRSKLRLEKELFELGFDRSSILIAWGGGVIGDLVGFLASTYMRGIPYYAFPSSVIAMVDSSIGGKTGIDTPYGKNLIGTLYPPRAVFIDVGFLTTLPKKEFINGCAEIAKYHCIRNPDIGKIIRKTGKDFLPDDSALMVEVIKESLSVKIEIVNEDETEQGLRRILNFGHTFGHALEHLSRYRIAHGYAIAIGMGVEAYWALRKKQISLKDFQEIHDLLRFLKLPIALPNKYDNPITCQELYRICQRDKKSQNREVYFVCLQGIGKVKKNRGEYREPITEKDFMQSLKEYNRFLSATS